MKKITVFSVTAICLSMLLPIGSYAGCDNPPEQDVIDEPPGDFRILNQQANSAPLGVNIPGFGGIGVGLNPCESGEGSDPIFNK